MSIRPVRIALITAGATLAAGAIALAGEPPNQNDPCGRAGRNTCGTTGVGSYQRYRYGLRWFGDYRGAIAEVGRAATFCLDLRYWYPGKQFRYAEITPAVFRNRDGKVVPQASLARMSYAIWNYGRSNVRNQQAATMLYVHGLMGDGAPGEVAKNAIGPGVEGIYDRIDRDARRLRGPYRVDLSMDDRLTVGTVANGEVRVRSATGAAMKGVTVTIRARNASGVTSRVRTDARGVAEFSLTAGSRGNVSVTATTQGLAAPRPRIFSPTQPAAARNGQRLAAPRGQAYSQEISRPVGRGTIAISSRAFPQVVTAGGNSRDRVTITGAPPNWRQEVSVDLYGPFPTKEAITCTGTPAAHRTFTTSGARNYTTPPAPTAGPGWYTYVISSPRSDAVDAVTTPCGEPTETFKAVAKPTMTSQVSKDRIRPNETLTTAVTLKGLWGQTVPVTVELFGPYASAADAKCDTPAIQTLTLTAKGDGTLTTDPVTLTTPGYYIYREASAATDLVEAAQIACGDPLETAVVVGSPKVVTQVSAQELTPGGTMHDTLVVTGLGALKATVNVELWGPYTTPAEMVCSGTPAWTGTVEANGDGTYQTADVRVNKVGYYTYRERIAEAPQNDAELGACGVAAETTIVKAAPDVTTTVSNAVVRPGSSIFDRLRVTGAGTQPLDIELSLYGPFPTKAAIRCTGTPVWRGTVAATNGDGLYRSEPVKVDRAGFYTYRERIAGSTFVTGTEGDCGESAETSLGAPAINTGRTAPPRIREAQASGSAPRRVSIPELNISAPVASVGIDVGKGELDVPDDIMRTGWWRDGAAPGSGTGSVVIAGHVDSARRGPGAFFRLRNARRGMIVTVQTASGSKRYRVTSVRIMAKDALPLSVWNQSGSERLTLVTCGGPFNAAAGHYRDNVVVTAVPA